ncbi:MAG: hypothetical protein R2705_00355 [Ilumatobacteraceae bacterium]
MQWPQESVALSAAEHAAWRSLPFANLLLTAELDHQLRRDAHLSLGYYGMLARLAESLDHRLDERSRPVDRIVTESPDPRDHPPRARRPGRTQAVPRGSAGAGACGAHRSRSRRARGGEDQHLDTVRRAVFDALRPEQIEAMHDVMSILVQHLDPSVASQMGIAPREEELPSSRPPEVVVGAGAV